MIRKLTLQVNSAARNVEIDERVTLLDVLRNELGLFGARFGCGVEQCGSCAVLIDGQVRPACGVEASVLEGKTIVTVEGIGTRENPHPIQTAMIEKQAGQCGYCLSGIVVGAKALLDRNPRPSRAEIAQALDWHLCRCGAHNRIIAAVELAAARMRSTP
ncbi:MAG TPA: (2Fe-2S)-binding protein [Rhizomicrobium sp.]|nr:(2Fe-2S)-binding protein [Rhizomicrobium sp.]